jgi:AcrR family transcriptional regulator
VRQILVAAPQEKLKPSQVSGQVRPGEGSVTQPGLADLMVTVRPHVGAHTVPTQARSKAKMARVLRVAADLLDSNGAEAVTTTSVAAGAGVSVGWLYNYFYDRTSLLEEILVAGLEVLDHKLDAAGFSLAGPQWRAAAEGGIDVVIAFFRDLPGFRSLWFSMEFSGSMIQANRLHDDALAAYLASSVTSVRSDAPDIPLLVVMKVFVGMLDKGIDLAFRDQLSGDHQLLAEMKRASIAYLAAYLT